jgi:hypothetical protein
VFGTFGIVDFAFILGNATKIPHGGWIPLALSAVMFALFVTWRDGRALLRAELQRSAVPLSELPEMLKEITRVPGTAVFLVSHQGYVPTALLRNLEHNKVCHENIVILHLEIQRTPRQDVVSRSYPEEVFPDVHVVHARFGFMETPDVNVALGGRGAPGPQDRPGHDLFPRLAPGARAHAPRHPRIQAAPLRLDAAQERPGRGILPHADQARRRARDGSRDLIKGDAPRFTEGPKEIGERPLYVAPSER